MRLLITGGTGFIGSRLARLAREAGHEVCVTGMSNTPAETANQQELAASGIEVRRAPIDEVARDPAALSGVDAVIHLAAAQHEMNVPDDHFRKVNVEGTEALFDAAKGAGVRRFVHGSTIGVYGDRDGTIDETTPTGPDNIYGVTKLEAERLLMARQAELPVVAIRISETYGPGDRRLLKLFKAIKKGRFFLIGPGRNLHHPVFIDDLAAGLLLAAEHPAAPGEIFVLPGREVVTTDEMVSAIAKAIGRQPPRLRAPLWPFMTAAAVLEFVLRPLGIQPPLHRRRMDFFKKSFSFAGDKATRILGFRPEVGFGDGAGRTARWYTEAGLL